MDVGDIEGSEELDCEIVKKKMKFFLKYDWDDREYGLLLECQDEQLGKIRY